MSERSIEFTGLSDDEPPIFRVMIAGDDPAVTLDSWLAEQPHVQRVHVTTVTTSSTLGHEAIAHLSERHHVSISVEERGREGLAGPAGA